MQGMSPFAFFPDLRHSAAVRPPFGKMLVVFLMMFLDASGIRAQVVSLYDVVYRPPGENWQWVSDGSFEVIYPGQHELQARELLSVLRETRAGTDAFLGVDRPYSLTAILSDQSDSGNGFVTPFPYKTEINAIALRGRGLSRRHHSWMEVVTAHELVHAAQAEFRVSRSVTGLMGRFAPDFARALGLFQPSGVVEGLAVYRESEIPPGAGRLNHPFFLMQARAGMMEHGGWSLTQALEAPSYTRPFNRFYLGGSLFVDYLMEMHGSEAIHTSLRWQQHLPISGYGTNLRLALDRSPKRLESEFRRWFNAREDSTRAAIGALSSSTTLASQRGRSYRRPYWMHDGSVVTYTSGYNLPRGFHRVRSDGSMIRATRNEITDDAVLYLVPGTGHVLYSRYTEHRFAPVSKTSWSYRVNLETGEEQRLEGSEHTYNPVLMPNGQLLALRSSGQYNRIVDITYGKQETRLEHPRLEIVSMAPRPGSDSLAVIVKTGTHQATFLVDTAAATWTLTPWIGFEGSTIYDGSWDRSGRYFAFTSDHTGVLNVYVMDAHTERLVQATNALYGAMEGHVSPDGKQLVFVEYAEEQFDLKTMDLDSSWVQPVNRDWASATWSMTWAEDLDQEEAFEELDRYFEDPRPYRAWRHLSPRMIYPTLYLDDERQRTNDARLGLGVGVAMQGTDPMQRLAWYSEGIIQKNMLWGELGFQSARFPFRPAVKLERRPTTVDAVTEGQPDTRRIIRDRVSWSVAAYLPYTIEQNVYRTSVTSSLALSYRSDRYLDDNLEALLAHRGRLAMQPSVFIGRRLVRNPRDIWPTSGQFISWFADLELNREVGAKRRGSVTLLNAYVPALTRSNTSIRLDAGHLYQNAAGVFGLTFFKPVGWSDAPVLDRHYARVGIRVRQPILFPDNGWLTVPVFLRAMYVRSGFETLIRLEDREDHFTSVSLGMGVKIRLWHFLDLDLAWDVAYRIEAREWDTEWTSVSEN